MLVGTRILIAHKSKLHVYKDTQTHSTAHQYESSCDVYTKAATIVVDYKKRTYITRSTIRTKFNLHPSV